MSARQSTDVQDQVSHVIARVDRFLGAAHDDEVIHGPGDRAAAATAVAAGLLVRSGSRLLVTPGTDRRVITARMFRGHLTCATAAEVLGYPTWSRTEAVHVVVPRNHGVRASRTRPLDGVVLHRTDTISPMTVDGFPVVEPAEVVACCLRCLDGLDAVCVADTALNRGDTTREEVESLLTGRYDRAASSRLEMADRSARSLLETRVRLALRAAGLRVETGTILEEIGEVDMLVEEWLIVETDGFEFHRSLDQFAKDRHRDQAALSQGYVPIRLTSQDVAQGEEYITATVVAALLGVARSRRIAWPKIPKTPRIYREHVGLA